MGLIVPVARAEYLYFAVMSPRRLLSKPLLLRRLGLTALGALAISPAWAGDDPAAPALRPSVWLRVGVFRPDLVTSARSDHPVSAAPGSDFSFEALGMPARQALPSVLLGVRLSPRWRAEFEVLRLNRNGQATLDRTLNFRDTAFLVSTELASSFRTDFYRASVGYSWAQSSTIDAGVLAGIHAVQFDLALRGRLSAVGQAVASQSAEQKTLVPLPTLGVYAAWSAAPQWQVSGRVDLFSLRHGHYAGRMVNAQANLMHSVTPHLGVGLGYRLDDFLLRKEAGDQRLRAEYRLRGPQVFLEWRP